MFAPFIASSQPEFPVPGCSLDLKSDNRTMMRLGYTEAAKVATPSAIFFT